MYQSTVWIRMEVAPRPDLEGPAANIGWSLTHYTIASVSHVVTTQNTGLPDQLRAVLVNFTERVKTSVR